MNQQSTKPCKCTENPFGCQIGVQSKQENKNKKGI